jgi:hypothetical protein
MIGQCLSNKNKSATVSKSKKILNLNKAYILEAQFVSSETRLSESSRKIIAENICYKKKNIIYSLKVYG